MRWNVYTSNGASINSLFNTSYKADFFDIEEKKILLALQDYNGANIFFVFDLVRNVIAVMAIKDRNKK